MLGWNDERPLKEVLPAKDATRIKTALGYTTCGELLGHYPRQYVRHGDAASLGSAQPGDIVTLTGTVTHADHRDLGFQTYKNGKRGKRSVLNVVLDGHISASFFNAQWQASVLKPGVRVMMSGKLGFYQGRPQLSHPDFMVMGGTGQKSNVSSGALRNLANFGEVEELLSGREWIPIYPATAKATSWFIMGAIHRVLESLPPVPEPLDYELPLAAPISFDSALREVHEPGPAGPFAAIERLKYNEALEVGLVMALRRKDTENHSAPALVPVPGGARDQLIASLPFELTAGQASVIEEISRDVSAQRPMARLLQGEVGSGKTMVALAAMLQAVDAGSQAALLAPTEVLAAQHASSIGQQVPDGVNVVLLTGSMKTAEKRQALLDIVSGDADIVIGTHAIIQDSVEFFKLGLVVIDEQHRFGVEQRESLRSKAPEGVAPHVLVMTATPIPRTIAMTVFGDLAVSTLTELPGGRKPIQSTVVPEFRPTWVSRALERIREEVRQGHQAFVVCPRVEGEGGVLELTEALENGPFRDLRVGMLHGRMADKDAVMADFAAGGCDVLVATTVIEVGVDVPNATVMLIRESELFGISQLHQLRGRVGRGGNASLCLFHTLLGEGDPGLAYIEQVAATSSGFELAELDLQKRQEGDVLGRSQSGTRKTLRLLNLRKDHEIINRSHIDAQDVVERNPELAASLIRDLSLDEQEFLDKN